MTFDKALEEIEERLNAATPGPWYPGFAWPNAIYKNKALTKQLGTVGKNSHINDENGKNDAVFIASSPTDIKQLLAVVKEMRGALNEVRKESLIQVPCPDGVVGCAVLHRKLDSRGKLASEALTKCDEIMGEK